ncbi:MAG: hypothetical protein A2541_02705 [Candidatus Taylorbacteria bacterium RIFOXYD2_FULL_36_9]|uniref:DUF4258 domain-containing protein n=1 Tax=Candidatus Taylorbacteria bacterium RIFOXYD2_FULL_36_9 TaxID=1802338 RepID=A0A1G2PF03_9BACT|nr:MAG: hypothetical protein A2541_02705 [Candidatus Taylorbacteria bacterium RIFOXYD2_FULL_36_9]
MKLRFSYHCQFRLYERKIDIDHIKKAIIVPDIKQDVSEGRTKVQKKIGEKIIKVVYYKSTYKDKKEEYNIITAYYL